MAASLIYTQGAFTDLCRGPHIPDTGFIKAIKLTNISGAYWKGDEKNKMLTRVYGVTFPNAKELDEYVLMLEEAKKRDHRKLGKELGIYTMNDDIGQGLILWMPNGTVIIEELEKLAKETETAGGYKRVVTPHIAKENLILNKRSPSLLCRQYVPAHGNGWREILPESNELPASP
jgi:threonyl-tRNA synthetase